MKSLIAQAVQLYFDSNEGASRIREVLLAIEAERTSSDTEDDDEPVKSTDDDDKDPKTTDSASQSKNDNADLDALFEREVEVLLKYSSPDTPRWCLPGLNRAQTQQVLTFRRKYQAKGQLANSEISLMMNLCNAAQEAHKTALSDTTLDDKLMQSNLIDLYLAVFKDDQGLSVPGVTQDMHDALEDLESKWKSVTLDDSDREWFYLTLRHAFETEFTFQLTYAHAIKPTPVVRSSKKRPAASAPPTSQSAPKTRKRHVDITIQQELVKYDVHLSSTMTSYANAHGGRKLEKWEIVQLVAHAAGYLRKHCRQGPKPQIIHGFISQQQANHGVTDPAHLELIAKQPWDPKSEFALRTKGN
jgi:hypothetical protein